MVCLLWVAGCFRNAGIGGTGEIVVPAERWQQIKPFNAGAVSLPPAASKPVKIAGPTTVELNIERARQLALQNNLDLHVDLINPTLAKETLSQAEAQFEATFFGDANYAVTDNATYSQLANSQAKTLTTDAGVNVPLRTGGTLNLTLPVDRFSTNNAFDTLNPAYETDLQASFSIPVLRGAGLYYNTQQVRVAFYEYQATLATTKLQVTQVLADVDRSYWRLYAARQELVVRQKQLDLANAQAERARRQVAAQVAAQVEIIRADSGVSDAVEQVITAENVVRTQQRELKRIINDPEMTVESDTSVIPATLPNATEYRLSPDRLLSVAMRDRMDLLATELHIAEAASGVKVARSDLLPLVTLSYQFQQSGLGPSFQQSYDQLERNRFTDHSVGVHVEIPIGNEAAKSRLRAALAKRLQQLATKQQQEAQIKEDVLNALDTLNLTWQRILASRQRVALNTRLVAAQIRQFEIGLQTSTEVLDAETKLADARSSEVAALTDYQIAQVDIAYATGSVLGASRVIWQPIAAGSKE
jgi:outer membrane protein TolC